MKHCLIAFLVTLALYAPSSRYALVRIDDTDYIVRNEHMREGLTADNVRWALTNREHSANWHPLTWLSLMADVSLDRLTNGGRIRPDAEWRNYDSRVAHIMHAHNVVLHAVNAALLVALALLVAGKSVSPLWCLLLGLFWSLHPLRVEAVCWVTERKELLSVMLGLVSTIAYLSKRRFGYVLSLAAFALALLAKSVVVSLPVILVAWDFIYGGRIRWRRMLPYFALAAVASHMTAHAQAEAIAAGAAIPMSARLAAILGGPVSYLRQTVWPVGLSPCYEMTTSYDIPLMLSGVVLLALMAWACLRWLRRRGGLEGVAAFAVAWCYVGLVPMIGIVKAGTDEHSDRFTYWAWCGLSVSAVLLLRWLAPRKQAIAVRLSGATNASVAELRRYALGGLAGLVLVFACLTWQRMSYWRDTVTLLRDAVPKSWIPNVASVLAVTLREERGEAAAAEGERMLRNCVTRYNTCEANIELAAFLLEKPRAVSAWERQDGTAYAEEEFLLESALAAEPDNERAKKLMEILKKSKAKLK